MLLSSDPIIKGLRQVSHDTWTLALDNGTGGACVLHLKTDTLLRYYSDDGVRAHAARQGLWLTYLTEKEWAELVSVFIRSGPLQPQLVHEIPAVPRALTKQ